MTFEDIMEKIKVKGLENLKLVIFIDGVLYEDQVYQAAYGANKNKEKKSSTQKNKQKEESKEEIIKDTKVNQE